MNDELDVEQAALMTHRSTPVVKEEQEDVPRAALPASSCLDGVGIFPTPPT